MNFVSAELLPEACYKSELCTNTKSFSLGEAYLPHTHEISEGMNMPCA